MLKMDGPDGWSKHHVEDFNVDPFQNKLGTMHPSRMGPWLQLRQTNLRDENPSLYHFLETNEVHGNWVGDYFQS
jgi:hypothetical protein